MAKFSYVSVPASLVFRGLTGAAGVVGFTARSTYRLLSGTLGRPYATVTDDSGSMSQQWLTVARSPSVNEKAHVGKRSKAGSENVLYAFQRSDPAQGNRRYFKVGKSISVKKRLNSYLTLDPHGTLVYQVSCKDIHFAEKLLHMILTKHGYHHKRELFLIEKRRLIKFMDSAQRLSDYLCEKGDDPDALWKAVKRL